NNNITYLSNTNVCNVSAKSQAINSNAASLILGHQLKSNCCSCRNCSATTSIASSVTYNDNDVKFVTVSSEILIQSCMVNKRNFGTRPDQRPELLSVGGGGNGGEYLNNLALCSIIIVSSSILFSSKNCKILLDLTMWMVGCLGSQSSKPFLIKSI
ncbi:hypothetical protein DERP_014282, partial [Dermatophagoides pteronyssinus]